MKVFIALLVIAAGGAAYYVFVYRPAHAAIGVAYALAKSVEVIDAPTPLHSVVGKLKTGDRVEVRGRTRNWVNVRLADGATGWVEAKALLDAQPYEAAQRLLKQCEQLAPQANGHAGDTVNLRLEPSRDAPQIAQLEQKQPVEIFGRRLMERAASSLPPPGDQSAAPGLEAWYLVRTDAGAGWALGRLVDLDVPESISPYAQGTNLVAWLVLNSVEDGGRQVPQYLTADRSGTQEFDFNHIRVLTWAKAHHRYATAYIESNLQGYFPIRVDQIGGAPYFRLRLIEKGGRKIQKVYAMLNTITHPLGTVDGWESNALPSRQPAERKRAPRATHGHSAAKAHRRHA